MVNKVSNGIMRVSDNGDENHESTFWRAQCSCMDDDHTHTMCMEFDKDHGVTLSLWADIDWAKYNGYIGEEIDEGDETITFGKVTWLGWFKEGLQVFWSRLKVASRVLFIGRIETTYEHIFEGQEQIQDYITALQIGLKKVQDTPAPEWKKRKKE